MSDNLKQLAQGVVLGALVMWALGLVFDTPVVYWSKRSGECTRVSSPDPGQDCANLPTRYESGWAQ